MGTLNVTSATASPDYQVAGVPDGTPLYGVSAQIGAKTDWVKVVPTSRFGCAAIDETGAVYVWGWDAVLGITEAPSPTQVATGVADIFSVNTGCGRTLLYLLYADGLLYLSGNTGADSYFGVTPGDYSGASPEFVGSGYANLKDIDNSAYAGSLFCFEAAGVPSFKGLVFNTWRQVRFTNTASGTISPLTPTETVDQMYGGWQVGLAKTPAGGLLYSFDYNDYRSIPSDEIASIFRGTAGANPAITATGALVYVDVGAVSVSSIDAGSTYVAASMDGWYGSVIAADSGGGVHMFNGSLVEQADLVDAGATYVAAVGNLGFFIAAATPPPPATPQFWQDLIGTTETP